MGVCIWPYATLSCVLIIAPTGFEGFVTSSYIESVCTVFAALFSSCSSTVAFFLTMFLSDIMTITMVNMTTQTIKATAKQLIATIYTVSVDEVSAG